MKKITYLIILFIFIFLLWNIKENLYHINSENLNFRKDQLLIMIFFLLPVYFINALSWHLVTKSLSMNLSYITNLRIWITSNISRYLPGVIWQYAGRIYLTKKQGISAVLTGNALVLEALFNLLTGSLIVITSIIFLSISLGSALPKVAILISIIFVLLIFYLNYQKLFSTIFYFLGKKINKGKKIARINLPSAWIPILVISYFLQFFFDGSVLFFLSRSTIDLPLNLYPEFIGIFAISWLAGYISVFAPSGLGVQEISIATLLSQYMPFTLAGIIAIVFRLALMGSEFLTFIIVVLLSAKDKRNIHKRFYNT